MSHWLCCWRSNPHELLQTLSFSVVCSRQELLLLINEDSKSGTSSVPFINFSAGDDHGSNNWHGVTRIQYVMTSDIQKRLNDN